MDHPPVNALPVSAWFELGEVVRSVGADPATRVVVLRAEGRGFNAGVDIKEMQASEGFDALIGANRGCSAAFAAVYECAVPVIAAVHGYCLGGGIGLVGNADVVVASDDATTSACPRWTGRARRRHPAAVGAPRRDRRRRGAATGFELVIPDSVPTSRLPTEAGLRLIREVIDRDGRRE